MLFTECWGFSSWGSLMWVVVSFPNGACCLWDQLLFVQLKDVNPNQTTPMDSLDLITILYLSRFHGGNCLKVIYLQSYLNLSISRKCGDTRVSVFKLLSSVAPFSSALSIFPIPYAGISISSWGNQRGHLCCSPFLWCHHLPPKCSQSQEKRLWQYRNAAFSLVF